eukprot:1161401-Pelagomonas_calceolata.AAC.29
MAMGMETCNSTGNVTLLANDYLQLTALAEPVPLVEGRSFKDLRRLEEEEVSMVDAAALLHLGKLHRLPYFFLFLQVYFDANSVGSETNGNVPCTALLDILKSRLCSGSAASQSSRSCNFSFGICLQGATVGGASLITSVTIEYKSSNCSIFAGNSTSLTIDGPTLDARSSTSYTFRDPRIWTTGTNMKARKPLLINMQKKQAFSVTWGPSDLYAKATRLDVSLGGALSSRLGCAECKSAAPISSLNFVAAVILDKFTMLNGTDSSKDFFSVRIITPYHEFKVPLQRIFQWMPYRKLTQCIALAVAQGSGVCVEGCLPGQTLDLSALLSGRRRLLSVSETEARSVSLPGGALASFLVKGPSLMHAAGPGLCSLSFLFSHMGKCQITPKSISMLDSNQDTAAAWAKASCEMASTSTTSEAYEAALEAAAKETAEFLKMINGSGASAAAVQGLCLLAILGSAALLLA